MVKFYTLILSCIFFALPVNAADTDAAKYIEQSDGIIIRIDTLVSYCAMPLNIDMKNIYGNIDGPIRVPVREQKHVKISTNNDSLNYKIACMSNFLYMPDTCTVVFESSYYASDEGMNVGKYFYVCVVCFHPAPTASTSVWLCDSINDPTHYSFYGFLKEARDSVFIDSLYSYDNHVVQIPVPSFSGDKSTWTWYVNGEKQSNDKPFTRQFAMDDVDVNGKTHYFQIQCYQNLPHNGGTFYGTTLAKVIAYPRPSVELTTVVETFSEHTDGFVFNRYGGIKDMWYYYFLDSNNDTIAEEDIKSITVKTDTLTVLQYFMYIRNGDYKRSGIYHGSGYLTYIVWPKPDASFNVSHGNQSMTYDESKDAYFLECCDGDSLTVSYVKQGGYLGTDDAWTLYTPKDTFFITNVDDGELKLFFNINDDMEPEPDGAYNLYQKVYIRNDYTGRYNSSLSTWYIDSVTIKAKIWKQVEWSDNLTLIDDNQNRVLNNTRMAIRQGNDLSLIADGISGGYKGTSDSFAYYWDINDVKSTTRANHIDVIARYNDFVDAERMSMGESTVTISAKNYGIDGTEWSASKPSSHTFTIYNRPHTPLSLCKKGDGTSGTLIATVDVSDYDLVTYDYYLIFGYTNANGKTIETAKQITNVRDSRFTSFFGADVINDNSNHFFVYAQWCYDDGVTITSGKRYFDSVDEKWDGSDYSGKGGTIGLIRRNDGALGYDVPFSEDEGISAKYHLNGQHTATNTKGISVVKYSDGKVKKIVNK